MRVVPFPTGATGSAPILGPKMGNFAQLLRLVFFFLNFELNLVLIPSIYLLNNRINFYDIWDNSFIYLLLANMNGLLKWLYVR